MKTIKIQTDYSNTTVYKDRFINDQTSNPAFLQDIDNIFSKKPLTILDVGCINGTLVHDFIQRGHNAVGLDQCNPKQGFWLHSYQKTLFSCDVSRNFSVLLDDKLMQCELIIGLGVADHIDPNLISLFFENVQKTSKNTRALHRQYFSFRAFSSKSSTSTLAKYNIKKFKRTQIYGLFIATYPLSSFHLILLHAIKRLLKKRKNEKLQNYFKHKLSNCI